MHPIAKELSILKAHYNISKLAYGIFLVAKACLFGAEHPTAWGS